MPDVDVYRDLGAHQADIENLKKEVHAMRVDLSEIKEILSEAKGGWRMLMAVSGLAATISSGITWMFFKLFGMLR